MFKFKKNFEKQETPKNEVEANLSNQKNEVEIDFPTAEEILEKTKKNWSPLTFEQIFQKIQKESNSGNREASFYNTTISDEFAMALKYKGYEVKLGTIDKVPYFKVLW